MSINNKPDKRISERLHCSTDLIQHAVAGDVVYRSSIGRLIGRVGYATPLSRSSAESNTRSFYQELHRAIVD